ncbi:GNAT family N-acetyltransferase [Paenibacillus sp. MMS20-IR301]|uniref:GNAT family N-acetyltransferase n=1 Tax=Paenibacillus sp. MMS20-IR301 TaxID=2895946 RepID=UPI0028EE86D5|nr:GNAT family N-acetyltransferase [Paenibacillus sp. MMS20-IR301]WNS47038.1 GNAT family N-acetyltransferase [Paenibacillus sp. MMS20-IR301]
MEYRRITSLADPLFGQVHNMLAEVFPPEEVLEYSLWKEPLEDPGIRVFAAVQDGTVVGTTEYRYYADWNVAMTDFTIIGREGLGVGRFLAQNRLQDLQKLAADNHAELLGMFAEIYDPYRVAYDFGGIKPMDPFVRREVLSHLGYKRIDFPYVHPSWQGDGEAVSGLDLCFMPGSEDVEEIGAGLVADFLTRYYAVLKDKPDAWTSMVEQLRTRDKLALLPL